MLDLVGGGQLDVDAAAGAGRSYALGQNQALVRWGQIAETEDEARRMVAEYDVDIFRDLYAGTTPMRFDPADPVDTPRVLDAANPAVLRALADAADHTPVPMHDGPAGLCAV